MRSPIPHSSADTSTGNPRSSNRIVVRIPRPRFLDPRRRRIAWRRAGTMAMLLLLAWPVLAEVRVEEEFVGGWLLGGYEAISSVATYRANVEVDPFAPVSPCLARCGAGDAGCYLACFAEGWPEEASMPPEVQELKQTLEASQAARSTRRSRR